MFGHDHETRGEFKHFGKNTMLVLIGIFQDGVQGSNDGHAHTSKKGEQMAAGRATVNAEFVLHAKDVHVGEIDEISGADVGGDIGLRYFEANFGRVRGGARVIGNSDDRKAALGMGGRHGVAEVAGESGDAALAGRVVPEEGDFVDRGRQNHSNILFREKAAPMGDFPTMGENLKEALPGQVEASVAGQCRDPVWILLSDGRFIEWSDRFTDSAMIFSGDLVFCFNARSQPPAAGSQNSNHHNYEY
jgi:hypothetical protein